MMLWMLARKELLFDRMMSICQIASIACILAPLLLLFSLRYGILQEMEQQLLNDPQVLSLSLETSYRLDEDFFVALRARPEVGYVVPEILALNALVDLKFPGSVERVSVITSTPGDPVVLQSGIAYEQESSALGDHECFITEQVAQKYDLKAGSSVQMIVSRTKLGKRQSSRVTFTVRDVVLERYVGDDYILLAPQVVAALDDYRNGYEPEIFSDGSLLPQNKRYYAKFRLYARNLESVIPLYYQLRAENFNVRSKVQEIENLQAVVRVLNFVFAVVASVSVIGGAMALGGLMLSSLKAKKRNLVLLRLMGQNAADTYLLVLLEAIIIALLGFVLALLLYYGGSLTFNLYFQQMLEGVVLSKLLPVHIALFLGATLLLAAITALWTAKYVLLKVHIADILREA